MQPNRKTKILYIVTKGVWGGAQKYVYSLATNLPKDQFETKVICGEGGVLKKILEEKGTETFELQSMKRDISILNEVRNLMEIYKIIKRERPDVIHLNSPKASGLGGLAGRILGVPKIIMTVHGFSFNEDRNILSKLIIRVFSWITIILCHQSIVIAKKEETQALSMPFISENKIKLIHNGVEKITYKEKNIARQEILGEMSNIYESNTTWIGTMAELHKNKGYKYIIQALSKIEKPFVFIAIGEGEERKNLENTIREHRLEEKVFLVGFKKNSAEYLKAFDIFTLTSIKEGLPYTIIEAGFAELPVISSNIGGIPDIIDNDINGILTESGNVPDIEKAIEKMIENTEMRNEFGNKLKEKVEKEFSLDQMLEKTIKLYN